MAARLAGYARDGQILIGEEPARRIGTLFPSNRPGKAPLKNLNLFAISLENRPVMVVNLKYVQVAHLGHGHDLAVESL